MLSAINTGELDTYITIESATNAKSDIGENVQTWSVLRSAHAGFKWKAKGEGFESQQEVGSQLVEIKIRFDQSITSTMRIKRNLDTTYFYIRSVQHWRREGYTLLTAERRDNE